MKPTLTLAADVANAVHALPWDRFMAGALVIVMAIALQILPQAGLGGEAAAAATDLAEGVVDADGNGWEDALDHWWSGELAWQDLRAIAAPPEVAAEAGAADATALPAAELADVSAPGPWQRGNLRLLCLGMSPGRLQQARTLAAGSGICRSLVALERFGGVTALEVDPAGLRTFMAAAPAGQYLLDRSGQPALVDSRRLIGVERLRAGTRELTGDWAHTVAIIDSGCDTAHDDLGDFTSDNIDGPPPEVGHAFDWFDAVYGWPVFQAYRVVGWHDVTDDFPQAQGPWDYHYHGTALAGTVAGAGVIDPTLHGVAQRARLTIVKFSRTDRDGG